MPIQFTTCMYKKIDLSHDKPILVNLKSNTMKNTLQR